VSRQLIQARAKQEGWSRAAGLAGRKAKAVSRRQIVARLFRALDEKMRQIEERIEAGAGEAQSAADAEKDARALSALAGLYGKLVELDEAAKRKSGRSGKTNRSEAAGDADRLREDLARRLGRLRAG
jgi:hypothetical protein